MDIVVIYNKETFQVMMLQVTTLKEDDQWTLSSEFGLAVFRNGAEPVFVENNGKIFIKPNGLIITPKYFE